MDQVRVVVVGADGTEAAAAALEWAVEQAERTGSVVEAVSAWQWPANYGAPLVPLSDIHLGETAAQVLAEAVAEVSLAHPAVEVRQRVVQGNASKVLVDLSQDAELLVVGSRGHGELVGALIGSVSEHCVAHAKCPVVVVKLAARKQEPAPASQ